MAAAKTACPSLSDCCQIGRDTLPLPSHHNNAFNLKQKINFQLSTINFRSEQARPLHKKNKKMNTIQNTVNLIGRTGVTPIIKTFQNGSKLAKFSLATNETVIEPNGKSIKTQWHHVIAWGIQADLVEKFVTKGQLVAVDGKLINRVFTDASGTNKKVTEIQVNDILLINPQKVSTAQKAS